MVVEIVLLGMVCSFVVILLSAKPAVEGVEQWDRTLGFGNGRRRRVSAVDVERLLVREISFDVAAYVSTTANSRGLTPSTMSSFAQRFGPESLAIAVSAELTEREVLGCVASDEIAHRQAADLVAFLNGAPSSLHAA